MSNAANITLAAHNLLTSIAQMSPDQIERIDTDYLDYALTDDAANANELFKQISPDDSYITLMSRFTSELIALSTEETDDKIEAYCAKLFAALIRYEISQR